MKYKQLDQFLEAAGGEVLSEAIVCVIFNGDVVYKRPFLPLSPHKQSTYPARHPFRPRFADEAVDGDGVFALGGGKGGAGLCGHHCLHRLVIH